MKLKYLKLKRLEFEIFKSRPHLYSLASNIGARHGGRRVSGRGRSQVTRRVTDQSSVVTPLQELALGLCRSSVKSANNESSATLQPFYTLQLDIQSDSISSVTDALVENFSSAILDGYTCSKTNMAVEASRILSLEELPPILIRHRKRRVCSGTSGGGSDANGVSVDGAVAGGTGGAASGTSSGSFPTCSLSTWSSI